MRPSIRNLLLTTTALLALGLVTALAEPQGPAIVGGTGSVTGLGTPSVTVNQSSDKLIINWNTFNLAPGDLARFNQPNSSSIALNRVTGGLGPSEIYGTISANGRVFIINRDGVLFGQGAVINTAGFLATTNDIKNSDFMAGRMNFSIPGRPDASIVNLGTITATNGGFAALVAPGVRNDGIITAQLGTVALASGNGFTLDFYGDKLITLSVGDEIASQVRDVATGQTLSSLITNTGRLSANGGRVELTAAAARHVVDSVINNKGVIEANSVGMRAGKIVIGAQTAKTKTAGAPKQTVKLAGTISAAGKNPGEKGGTIVVTGENIEAKGAKIDASGQAGGGKVMIGGDWGGGNPAAPLSNPSAQLESYAIATASTVTIDATTTINASALSGGNGGKVVVWSDAQTNFAGTILARGGELSGNGGFVEVSSHGQLNYLGTADTRALNGATGTLLLDPADYYIVTTLGGSPDGASEITNTALQNQLAISDVILATDNSAKADDQHGDIFVKASVNWASSTTLTLDAYRNITVASGVTIANTAAGSLIMRADSTGTGTGTVKFQHSYCDCEFPPPAGMIDFSNSTGTVSIFYNPASNPADSIVNATSYTSPTNYSSHVLTNYSVPNQLTAYMLVNTAYDLQNIQNNMSGVYALGKDIDASITANWNGGLGFMPLGGSLANTDKTIPFAGVRFSGTFDGLGHTIANLYINRPTDDIGLFARLDTGGIVRNVGLVGASISGQDYVGGLVGFVETGGKIDNSYVVGTISGNGTASADYTPFYVGGLVGFNGGRINNSYASGVVNGGQTSNVGGLVGSMNGTGVISNSYSSSAVSGIENVGGLVGQVFVGSVDKSYATGSVTGTNTVGGLIGFNNGGTVTQTYASGAVSGTNHLGGLVGLNTGSVSYSYWDTQTTGQMHSAGSADSFGLTTAQAMQSSNYVGWNFTNDGGAWFLLAGQTRPFLRTEWSTTITNTHQLQLMAMHLGAYYTLGNNIDFAADLANPASMWSTAGFAPVGTAPSSSFAGVLDGQQHTIDHLTIAPTNSLQNVGLFGIIGNTGVVQNLTLANVNITANPNAAAGFTQFVGPLAGTNAGTILNVSADGQVNGGTFVGLSIGGLVGQNGFIGPTNYAATITSSHSAVNVTAGDGGACPGACISNEVGGLAGSNVAGSTITQSSASGTISAGAYTWVGGLVGVNGFGDTLPSKIDQSSATGTVTATGSGVTAGGLVGLNIGTIDLSSASGVVTVGDGGACPGACNFNVAGGLVGDNSATITNSSASGNVIVGTNAYGGGLVGSNQKSTGPNAFFAGPLIQHSFATGNVSSAGHFVLLGGLVGFNAPLARIETSYATGNVTSTATIAPSAGLDCSVSSCENASVGGLVGMNFGIIDGLTMPATNATCGTGYTCASGIVTVGSHGSGGGLVGQNDGTINMAFATGQVIGAAGTGDSVIHDQGSTHLGGLVAFNSGTITHSFARGDVGGLNLSNLQVGGLVSANSGTILYSSASGNVRAGDFSAAGGLFASNGPDDFNCGGCTTGNGHNNLALITNSSATGNVTVGNASVAGGFGGGGGSTITDSSATGNVTGGNNSLLGGFVGFLAIDDNGNPGLIQRASASVGSVIATGSNSAVGGFAGASFGTITNSTSSGPVTGTSESFLGGFTGINIGSIIDSTSSSPVTGTGSHNIMGGLVGLNFGFIDPSSSSGAVTGGPNSVIGGIAGVNGGLDGVPSNLLPGSTFPTGTISPDTFTTSPVSGGPGSTVGPQVGQNFPSSGLPVYPSILFDCDGPVCNALRFSSLFDGGGNNNGPGPADNLVKTIDQILGNVVLTSLPTDPIVAPPPPPAGTPGQPPQPGSGQPPPNPFAERFFALPPLDETRFVVNEVVVYLPCDVSQVALDAVLRDFGLTVLDKQCLGVSRTAAYRMRFTGSITVANIINAMRARQIIAAAQPNYTYALTQAGPDLSGTSQEGDAAQYVLQKLQLATIHRQFRGGNISIAVIDSEIDGTHPDLEGTIAGRYDATGAEEPPHSHGTGMAGAIVSHQRLMGVAPGARLYAVRAFSSRAATADSTTFQIIKGLDWAITQHVRVVNMSFAGPFDPSLERAIKVAHDKGIVLIAAAGNAGPRSKPLYPGADRNVIAVTATDVNDRLFTGANRGDYVAVAAPGVDILVPGPGGTYQMTTGTSVATAHVSGVVALLLERNPNLTPEDIRRILTTSAKRLGPAGGARNDDFGSGLVDPAKALQYSDPRTSGRPPQAPPGPRAQAPAPTIR